MDPASILGIITAAGSIVSAIHKYTSGVKDARGDAKVLGEEVSILSQQLKVLQDFLRTKNAMEATFSQSTALHQTLKGCERELVELSLCLGKLNGKHRLSKLFHTLTWPLNEESTQKHINTIMRYLQTFHLMMTVNSLMSKNCNEVVTEIMEKLSHSDVEQSQRLSLVVELLTSFSEVPKQVEKIHRNVSRVRDDMARVQIDVDKTRNDVCFVKENAKDNDFIAFLSWLPSLPVEERHQEIQLRRVDNCGSWFLESERFTDWRQGQAGRTLWCPGVPGAGKTFLTSIVVDHIHALASYQRIACAYFYFDYMDRERQTPFKIVASLLKQVLSAFDGVPSAARELFSKFKRSQRLPLLADLTKVLCDVCKEHPDASIIMDALDECDAKSHRPAVLRVIEALMQNNIKLLVTSRPFADDINDKFASCSKITITANEADIRELLKSKLDEARHMKRLLQDGLSDEIFSTILANAQGMFLLPSLQIDSILDQTTPRGIRNALAHLPKTLWGSLEITLDRIRQQPSENRVALALATLMWISYAKRPLKIDEIRHAVATEPGYVSIDESYLSPPELFTECCMGLVALDSETSTIRFVHLTVEEYLQQQQSNLFPEGSKRISKVCLTYLQFQDFGSGPCQTNGELLERTDNFPLLGYASQHWGDHARDCFDAEMKAVIIKYTSAEVNRDNWSQLERTRQAAFGLNVFEVSSWRRDDEEWRADTDCTKYSHDLTLLHFGARFGIQTLVEPGSDAFMLWLNVETSRKETPLMLAARFQHLAFVRMLLGFEAADVNHTGEDDITALGMAVKSGATSVIDQLLEDTRVDINVGCPLACAIEDGNSEVAYKLLSNESINVNPRGKTPLCEALLWNRFDIFQVLLRRKDIDPYSPDAMSRLDTALYLLVEDEDIMTDSERDRLVKMLLMLLEDSKNKQANAGPENTRWLFKLAGYFGSHCFINPMLDAGLDPFSAMRDGTTLLHMAVSAGLNMPLVDRLLAAGVPASATDKDGWSVLHQAAALITGSTPDDLDLVKLLVQRGASISAKDKDGWSVLHAAVKADEAIPHLLLDLGGNPKETDNKGRSVLQVAADYGKVSTMRLLIQRGANPWAVANDGTSVLHDACSTGGETANVLFSLGVFDAQPNAKGETVLMHAVMGGDVDVVRTLLARGHGAHVNWASRRGDTALVWASWYKNTTIFDMILDSGANTNARDFTGLSPLHCAVARNDAYKCEALLSRRADPNAFDALWGTPLEEATRYHKEACIPLLVKSGANPTISGPLGRNALDWASNYSPHFHMLGEWTTVYSPTTQSEVSTRLQQGIQRALRLLLTEGISEKGNYLGPLARMLLEDGKEEAFKILIEEGFGSNGFTKECSVCSERIGKKPRYLCRNCWDVDLCQGCVAKHPDVRGVALPAGDKVDEQKFDEATIPWCRGHEFFEVPREDWYSVPTGVVNKEGQNFEDWLKEIAARYGVYGG